MERNIPLIYPLRLPFGINSKQSNLCRSSAMTFFPSYLHIFPCVSAQYPRNRTIFLCLTLIRVSTSWINFLSSNSDDRYSFFTATVPFRSSPCSARCTILIKTGGSREFRYLVNNCKPTTANLLIMREIMRDGLQK